jgi:hypothetical protein
MIKRILTYIHLPSKEEIKRVTMPVENHKARLMRGENPRTLLIADYSSLV